MFGYSVAYYIRLHSLRVLKPSFLLSDKRIIGERMETPTLVCSQDVDALLSDLPDYTSDELMRMLWSPAPPPGPPPPASPQLPPPPPEPTTTSKPAVSKSFMELLGSTSMKATVQKKKRTAWNKGLRKGNASQTIPLAARRRSPRRRCTLANVVSPPPPPTVIVVELPTTTVIEEEVNEPLQIATMATTPMHAEVMSATSTNAILELGEAPGVTRRANHSSTVASLKRCASQL